MSSSRRNKASQSVFALALTLAGGAFALPGMVMQPWHRAEPGVPKTKAVQRWIDSVAAVRCPNGSGNGIFVSPKHVLTVDHVVVCAAKELTAVTHLTPKIGIKPLVAPSTYKAKEILWRDETLDLALIEIKPPYSPHFLPLTDKFKTESPEIIFFGGYYVNNLLWITRDILWAEDPKRALPVMGESGKKRIIPVDGYQLGIGPAEKGVSGSAVVGFSKGEFRTLGLISTGMWANRSLEGNQAPQITDSGGRGDIIVPKAKYVFTGGGDGIATMFLTAKLGAPAWEAAKEHWQAAIEVAEEAAKEKEADKEKDRVEKEDDQ